MSEAGTAGFLRRVPVLAGLDDDSIERLASQVTTVTVRAGDWLVREGEPADSLYLIRSGRLEVVAEGPPEAVIRVLRRGEMLGELALLTDAVRSASIRAQRDTELLELSRPRFEELILNARGFALGLTKSMGAQLAASQAPAATPEPARTIAALPLDPHAPVLEAAEMLTESLRRHGSAVKLRGEGGRDASEMIAMLEGAESRSERVVLVCESPEPGDSWTDFCLREADTIFALTRGAPSRAWLDHPEALLGCELVVLAESADQSLLDALKPREVQVLPEGSDLQPSVDLTARRLTGNAIGLVLSGGGARALAHLGVLAELARAGIVIDRIGAVSLGSLVGGGFAAEADSEEMLVLFRRHISEMNPTGDYTLPAYSIIRGARVRGLLRGFFGERRIEELRTRYFCVSCDLIGREAVVHKTGPLAEAIIASLSIPGVFPPVSAEDGRLLVDGGVLDNLPVGTMAEPGEGPVIAVDVTGRFGDFRKPVRPGVARLGAPLRRYLTGSDAQVPRLGETIVRTVTVGSADTAEAARRHADLVIQPRVEGVGMVDWRQVDGMIEAGREATRRALENPPAWLTASGSARSRSAETRSLQPRASDPTGISR